MRVGIDITRISRICGLFERFGVKGLRKFLSDDEILLCVRGACEKHKNIAFGGDFENLNSENFNFNRLAGFWAAKEALSKAFGCGISENLSFLDMQICLKKNGAPKIKLKKSAQILKRKKFQNLKNKHIKLSISHDADCAIALVVLKF